jgi:hypothetical protein
MIMKHEWRKKEKELYIPKTKPTYINIPELKYITIKGEGNPNSDAFSDCIQALYGMSYGVRMSYKWDNPPKEYYEYTVYPLEGIWDLIDPSIHVDGDLDKNNLKYEIMIRQPEFLDTELFNQVLENVKKKNPSSLLDLLEFKKMTEGPCIQMLHLGSYDSEPESFKLMETYAKENGYIRESKIHKEVYLTDARKTTPEKYKTTLRFTIKT